jgi:hypothetical protein
MLRDAYEIDKFFISIQELMSEMDAQLAHWRTSIKYWATTSCIRWSGEI